MKNLFFVLGLSVLLFSLLTSASANLKNIQKGLVLTDKTTGHHYRFVTSSIDKNKVLYSRSNKDGIFRDYKTLTKAKGLKSINVRNNEIHVIDDNQIHVFNALTSKGLKVSEIKNITKN